MMTNVQVLPSAAALAEMVAAGIAATARDRIARTGRFALCLSGGGPPRAYHRLLARPELAGTIDWSRVHVFWSDERAVPPDHPESNYGMAHETLLRLVPIPADQIHRIEAERGAQTAAERYEQVLHRTFGATGSTFDLVLLGMGDDGHTASLFPGSPALREATHWALAVAHDIPPPPLLPRVTLTPAVLNRAARVWIVISGAGKAARVAQALRAPRVLPELPVTAIQPESGPPHWYLDADAAAQLDSSTNRE
ncbi:MAG: 6-phosphogluconolactonase [Chloroflexi bacterium]|nr:6-phosphogluconolactonase [Chloroflexota bacterium]